MMFPKAKIKPLDLQRIGLIFLILLTNQSHAQYIGVTTGPAAPVDVQYMSGDNRPQAYSEIAEKHGFNSDNETVEYGWTMGVPDQFGGGTNFKATNIHTDSLTNLSGGGTFSYVMGWAPGINRGVGTPGDNGNQMLQLGLISAPSLDGDQYFNSGTDSFYLTGYETNWTDDDNSGQTYISQFNHPDDTGFYPKGSAVNTGILTLNLRLSDETGATLFDFNEFDFKYTSGDYAEQMIFYLFNLEFRLNEDGAFDFNMSADEYHQFVDNDIENGWELTQKDYLTASATGNHNLDDLSSLYAAFGIDVVDNANVGNTGATYDALAPTPVPESGVITLFGIAGAAFLLGRRRK